MDNEKTSIHIEMTHSCGQVYTCVLHLKNDDAYSIDYQFPMSTTFADINKRGEMFTLPTEQFTTVTLKGHLELAELKGIPIDGCIKCGKKEW